MADIYNSNSVPHSFPGGVCQINSPAGLDLGDFVIESFTTERPDHVVDRPDGVGGDGGFAITAAKHATAQITVQVPKSTDNFPPSGSYFEVDTGAAEGEERWVLHSPSQKIDAGAYWTMTYQGKLDRFAPAEAP